MKTEDLINQLGTNLPSVERLPNPGRRALLWLSGSVIYLALLAVMLAATTSSGFAIDSNMAASQLLGVMAGVLAAIAALTSVVPGRSKRAVIAAAAAALAWLASFALLALGAPDDPPLASSQHEWVCVATILLGGAPMIVALAAMLRKGAPINPVLTGFLAALAVGLLANFSACVSLPHEHLGVAFLWHVGAVGALVLLCALGGRSSVLNWGATR